MNAVLLYLMLALSTETKPLASFEIPQATFRIDLSAPLPPKPKRADKPSVSSVTQEIIKSYEPQKPVARPAQPFFRPARRGGGSNC